MAVQQPAVPAQSHCTGENASERHEAKLRVAQEARAAGSADFVRDADDTRSAEHLALEDGIILAGNFAGVPVHEFLGRSSLGPSKFW